MKILKEMTASFPSETVSITCKEYQNNDAINSDRRINRKLIEVAIMRSSPVLISIKIPKTRTAKVFTTFNTRGIPLKIFNFANSNKMA